MVFSRCLAAESIVNVGSSSFFAAGIRSVWCWCRAPALEQNSPSEKRSDAHNLLGDDGVS